MRDLSPSMPRRHRGRLSGIAAVGGAGLYLFEASKPVSDRLDVELLPHLTPNRKRSRGATGKAPLYGKQYKSTSPASPAISAPGRGERERGRERGGREGERVGGREGEAERQRDKARVCRDSLTTSCLCEITTNGPHY